MKLVEDKQLEVEGVVLVTVDPDGNVAVKETGDHLGRKGLEIGGGVGLVVGLFAPPLLAATVVGGAVGGWSGKFARHRVESGLEDKMGAALPPGSAGIVAIYDRAKTDTVNTTLASAVRKSVAPGRRRRRQGTQGRAGGGAGRYRCSTKATTGARPTRLPTQWLGTERSEGDRQRRGAVLSAARSITGRSLAVLEKSPQRGGGGVAFLDAPTHRGPAPHPGRWRRGEARVSVACPAAKATGCGRRARGAAD